MAEFCLECFNRINKRHDPPEKYIISEDLDLCEGCGKMKPVVVAFKKNYYPYRNDSALLPFYLLYLLIEMIVRLALAITRRIRKKAGRKQKKTEPGAK